ncbi:hypothetical protein FACS1894205_7480 [Alphaproteobacteria bacterium]|nr:hypothetical protein FACS1894205_7480 [Alphaproteobacteria bacterium]
MGIKSLVKKAAKIVKKVSMPWTAGKTLGSIFDPLGIMPGNKNNEVSIPTMPATPAVVPTVAPSLADTTAQSIALDSRRRNAGAGQSLTLLGGNLGAANTSGGKTLLGQ